MINADSFFELAKGFDEAEEFEQEEDRRKSEG